MLGKELISQSEPHGVEFISPSSKECDVRDYESVLKNISSFEGDVVLHSAAKTNISKIEKDPSEALEVNVLGTLNVLKACREHKKKLIFVSTDHVFDGSKGDYCEDDPINPISKYAKSKAASELIVRTYDNSLVVRTSFFPHYFPYEFAFVDQWSSKEYVDLLVPKFFSLIKGNKKGVFHLGNKKRSLYDIAKERKFNVKPIYRKDIDFPCKIGIDYSFKQKKRKKNDTTI